MIRHSRPIWLPALLALTTLALLAGAPAPARAQSTITTTLQPGLNLIGWTAPDTGLVLATAGLPVDVVFGWDPSLPGFTQNRPGTPLPPTLGALRQGGGYWLGLDADAPVQWIRPGNTGPLSIPLDAGFNLAAWGGHTGTPVADAVASLGEALISVSIPDGAGGLTSFDTRLPAALRFPLFLDAGIGMWLQMAAPATWNQAPISAGMDFGDAPDGGDAGYHPPPLIAAFPSLAASDGARIRGPGLDTLGRAVSGESDANLVNQDPADDGLTNFVVALQDLPLPASFAVDVSVAPGEPGGTRYLNVLIDLNQDARWGGLAAGGEPEWAVRNYEDDVVPGATVTFYPDVFALSDGARLPDGWMRILLTREPITVDDWDGSGVWDHGEVEDYRLRRPAEFATQPVPILQCPRLHDLEGERAGAFQCTLSNLGAPGLVGHSMLFVDGNVLVEPNGLNTGPTTVGADPVSLAFTTTQGQPTLPATGVYHYRAAGPDAAFVLAAGAVTPRIIGQQPGLLRFRDEAAAQPAAFAASHAPGAADRLTVAATSLDFLLRHTRSADHRPKLLRHR